MTILKNILKWAIRILLGIILLWIILGTVLVTIVIPRTDIKAIVNEQIDKVIKVKHGYSNVDFTFFESFPYVSFVVDDIYLIDSVKVPADTILTMDRLKINLNLLSTVVEKRLSFRKIELTKPFFHFEIDSTGRSNIDNVIVPNTSKSETRPIIYLNNFNILKFSLAYDNKITKQNIRLNNLELTFQGRINTQDSVLDIRNSVISANDDDFGLEGCIKPDDIDLKMSYKIKNVHLIETILSKLVKNEELGKYSLGGRFDGDVSIKGKLRDTTENSIKLKGLVYGKGINLISSDHSKIVNDGNMNIDYTYDIAHPDSLYLNVKTFEISGDNISLNANGKISHVNNDFYIDASVSSKGDLTKLAKQTKDLAKGRKIRGKYDIYINVNSSLNDLRNKYVFPKKLNNISKSIVIPNITAQIDLQNLYYKDKQREISSDKIKLYIDGTHENTIVKSNIADIRYKDPKLYVTAKGSDISLNGNSLDAKVDINGMGIMSVKGKDSTTIQSYKIKFDFAAKKDYVAEGTIEKLMVSNDSSQIFGAKIFTRLQKKNIKNKSTLWDAILGRAFILTIRKNDINAYGKIIEGNCKYEKEISDVHVTSDTIDIKVPRNELFLSKVNVSYDGKKHCDLLTGNIGSRTLDFGIGFRSNSLKLTYDNNNISLSTNSTQFGNSKFNLNGNISIADKNKPVIRLNLDGPYLDLNEIVRAQNLHALASGDPNAIPLDSIPKGGIPIQAATDNRDITLGLSFKKFLVSEISLNNIKGNIIIKGKRTLLDHITCNSFTMTSLLDYIDRNHTNSYVLLEANNLDMDRLFEIMPQIGNASPMLSAVKGTLDLSLALQNSVRKVMLLDIKKAKVAASLQARNLSINNNEELSKVAKTLMFKDKENIAIDSLAVAAKIENGNVKIYPFMLKVDRYKVAMEGENSLITEAINYHVSVLKSPVPFKFGLNIIGTKPYKIKLEKALLKKLDPSTKPWTDIEFSDFKNSITKHIENF